MNKPQLSRHANQNQAKPAFAWRSWRQTQFFLPMLLRRTTSTPACAFQEEIVPGAQAEQSWNILAAREKQEGGWFLVSAIVMILFLTAIGFSIAGLVSLQYQHTKREMFTQNAELVAEAGLEQSVHELNTDDSFAGYASDQPFFSDATQGKATFTTTITDNADGNSKTIISTGKVYRNASDANPYLTRKVRATVVGTGSEGYSVFSGPGGLILDGNSGITNSDVFVGGTISLNANSTIGTNSNPVNVDVANKSCPKGSNPGPTYPQVCTDGTQPITIASNGKIYGTVCATGQTSANHISGGSDGAGLKVGCTAPDVTEPTYDRQAQINAVTTTASASSNPYSCKTWPANLKLTGNVSISGNCNATISGNVYITGNLTISGNSALRVSAGAGAVRPVIIVDGTINVSGNVSMIANSGGTGIQFISFKSSASCSPGCTSVTGTDLKNSQSLQTVTLGGNGNMPGMIFDAYWGKIYLGGNGNMGAAIGQTVELDGNGTVIFGTKLSSGSKTWSITSYQPLF